MKHNIQDCPAAACGNCKKDHHSLICPEERREQKLHKAQDEEDSGDRTIIKTSMGTETCLKKIYNFTLIMKVLVVIIEMTIKLMMNMVKSKTRPGMVQLIA